MWSPESKMARCHGSYRIFNFSTEMRQGKSGIDEL